MSHPSLHDLRLHANNLRKEWKHKTFRFHRIHHSGRKLEQHYNRPLIRKGFQRAWNDLKRTKQTVYLALLDHDSMGVLNALCGPYFVEFVLTEFYAASIPQLSDVLHFSRFDDDGFAFLAHDTTLERIQQRCEQWRSLLDRFLLPEIPEDILEQYESIPSLLTASVGIAGISRHGGGGLQRLWEETQNALEEAKSRGKNRVVVHAEFH